MKLICNGKEIDHSKKAHRKALERGTPNDLVTGRVLTAEEATAEVQRSTNILFSVIGVLAWLFSSG